jgi:tRNA nucleotidyltransferase/poly(A) polymerase
MGRPVRQPHAADLGPELAALQEIARRLQGIGARAWIVGGAVRDLALGRHPTDFDLASTASPEEVERVFERTVAVGRAFGTVVIQWGGRDYQHTTFRSESGYSDRRHPDQVSFGAELGADARRRDFTCNALYLDPLEDVCADPEGGLADLSAGILRAVGDPVERFREDGLRLLRMARFAARLELAGAPGLFGAAKREREGLAGVSAERIAGELERIFGGPHSAAAVRILVETSLLEHCLHVQWSEATAAVRLQELERLAEAAAPRGPGLACALALLLAPGKLDPAGLRAAEGTLEPLAISRAVRRAVLAAWRLLAELDALLAAGGEIPRARRVRLVRDEAWPTAAALARARRGAAGEDTTAIEELSAFRGSLGEPGLHPAALLGPDDFRAAGIAPGPRYGALVAELEELQLDERVTTADEARAWLSRRARGD